MADRTGQALGIHWERVGGRQEVSEELADAVRNAGVEVCLPDGSRWSATISTLVEVERLMMRWTLTGNTGRQLFLVPEQCEYPPIKHESALAG